MIVIPLVRKLPHTVTNRVMIVIPLVRKLPHTVTKLCDDSNTITENGIGCNREMDFISTASSDARTVLTTNIISSLSHTCRCVHERASQYLQKFVSLYIPCRSLLSYSQCRLIIIIIFLFIYNAPVPVLKTSSKHSTASHQTYNT